MGASDSGGGAYGVGGPGDGVFGSQAGSTRSGANDQRVSFWSGWLPGGAIGIFEHQRGGGVGAVGGVGGYQVGGGLERRDCGEVWRLGRSDTGRYPAILSFGNAAAGWTRADCLVHAAVGGGVGGILGPGSAKRSDDHRATVAQATGFRCRPKAVVGLGGDRPGRVGWCGAGGSAAFADGGVSEAIAALGSSGLRDGSGVFVLAVAFSDFDRAGSIWKSSEGGLLGVCQLLGGRDLHRSAPSSAGFGGDRARIQEGKGNTVPHPINPIPAAYPDRIFHPGAGDKYAHFPMVVFSRADVRHVPGTQPA